MKIICGLGNPGRQYEDNRHNIGFRVLEALAEAHRAHFASEKTYGETARVSLGGHKVVLIKPQTFMNLSGRAVGALARFYKVEPVDVLVVHDELDLPFGKVQLKQGGGTGGHNGLNSMREHWGEQDFGRLRFGIGKPEGPGAKERVVGHVLGDFAGDERAALPPLVSRAVEACDAWAVGGMQKAMNALNRKKADD